MNPWTAALLVVAVSCTLVPFGAWADWAQFRGPNGSGVATGSEPPASFGPSNHLSWSTQIPPGHSSPAIAGARVYLTAFEAGKLETLALDRRTGRILWRKPAPPASIEPFHEFASPASPSPLADAERVVVYFGSFGLICYDREGRELWSRALPTPKNTYGTSASPIRVGNTAVVVLDSNDKASRLLAVNLSDGAIAWETPRPLFASGWATPMVWEHDGMSEIVVLGARRLTAYDSRTGQDRWWVDGYSPETISVPVAGEGMLFVSSAGLGGPPSEGFETMRWAEMVLLDRNGDGKVQKDEVPPDFRYVLRPELPPDNPGRHQPTPFRRMFDSVDGDRDGALTETEFAAFVKGAGARATPTLRAIRPGGKGDASKTHIAWQFARGIPEIPSPLFHRGRIYMARDGGFVTCVRASTGEMLYQERIGAPGSMCASPVASGDHIYLSSHQGTVVCLDASSENFKVLSRNELSEKIWATPALDDGTLYVRTDKHLFAFGNER